MENLGLPSCPLWLLLYVLLLFLFGSGGCLRLRSGNTGQDFVKRFFGRHLFATAFVVAVFVFAVAGAAAGPQHLFAHHGNNGMVGRASAPRTMVVNIVAQSHRASSAAIVMSILPRKRPCCLVL